MTLSPESPCEKFDETLPRLKEISEEQPCETDVDQEYATRRGKLPCMVKFYLWLRRKIISPPLTASELPDMQEMLENMKTGRTTIKSTIEKAILRDIEAEEKGLDSTNHVKKAISCSKMIDRFTYMFLQVGFEHTNKLSQFFMIYFVCWHPGVLTLVYPLSMFGYEMLKQSRDSKTYWYAILLYTQVLMIIEFGLSLFLTEPIVHKSLRYYSSELAMTYSGLSLP